LSAKKKKNKKKRKKKREKKTPKQLYARKENTMSNEHNLGQTGQQKH
jgi:replication initiation and membrane attachment protein DnaB